MSEFDINKYIHSLPSNINILDISNKNITYIPDISRFKNLRLLNCSNNNLSSLPPLNETLQELYCSNNRIKILPKLNENLLILNCNDNNLTMLPKLNKNLKLLLCANNNLAFLPDLNDNLCDLYCKYNPIQDIFIYANTNYVNMSKTKDCIKKLNNFRHLYFCLKFKNQFRKWLWIKIREPNIIKLYHPSNLIKQIQNEEDLDNILDNW